MQSKQNALKELTRQLAGDLLFVIDIYDLWDEDEMFILPDGRPIERQELKELTEPTNAIYLP